MAPITFISEPPHCITIHEHRQLITSTPESFSDIPPVLHHKEENLSITLDPPLQGFTEEDCANGTLYVVESALFFLSVTGKGIRIEHPTITLHAVARGDSIPKVYCQLSENTEDLKEENEDDDYMRELNLIPSNPVSVEAIFEALSTCAALHPDPQGDDGGESDGAFIDATDDAYENGFETFTGNDGEELSAVGRTALDYLESIIADPQNLVSSRTTTTSEKPQEDPNQVNGIDKDKD